MARALVGLGANLGDRPRTLSDAVQRLGGLPATQVLARSAWQETAPIGGPDGQHAFLNGAALLDTSLTPQALHGQLHVIESALGRRRSRRWEARVVDLDLLLFDDLVLHSADLEVPHPGLAFRRFVLEPAAEVAADMLHPLIGWTVGQLLQHLNAAPNYLALAGREFPFKSDFAARLAASSGAQLLTLADDENEAGAGCSCAGETYPPVQSLECGIKLLAVMQRKLVAVATADARTHVSDFWWGEFPAYIVGLAPHDSAKLLDSWRKATSCVPVPKLVISFGANPAETRIGPQLHVDPATMTADALAEVAAAMQAMR